MPNDQGNETPQAGKTPLIERLGNAIRKHRLATGLAAAIGVGVVAGGSQTQPQPEKADHGPGITTNTDLANWTNPKISTAEQNELKGAEINFLDWYRLPKNDQRSEIDSFAGKNVVVNVKTPDLKLHLVESDPDNPDGDKLFDMIVDPSKEPLPIGPDDGHPVRIRLSNGQYEQLKKSWKTESSGPYSDLVVPEGAKVLFTASIFPRHLNPGNLPIVNEVQLAYITFTPPQTSK